MMVSDVSSTTTATTTLVVDGGGIVVGDDSVNWSEWYFGTPILSSSFDHTMTSVVVT